MTNTRQRILHCPPGINRHGQTPKFFKLQAQRSNLLFSVGVVAVVV